ncbi:hypothetical protein PDJAM_G00191290 [Pangasius djambal]|uniref:Uncharacterized protein n=1 Tax=Pangasius djambal TaxID=1691987 RepID=A0ACC5Y5X3_9TELE|nr:hypothetical protein [Pangasius djambal]
MGLYYLKSSYVSLSSSLNVTFTLKNQLLNQDLLRPVSITYGGENHSCGAFKTAIIVVCALCVLLFLIIIVLLIKMQRRACRHSKPSANGTVSGKKELEVCLGIVKDREVSVSSDHLSP